MKSVQVNGADVTDTGIEFKPGEDVTGIEIELTQKTTAIAGSVTDARGQSLKDYTVVVFAEDSQKWTLPMNRWTASARPDSGRPVQVHNLPAGTYYAIAVDYVRPASGTTLNGSTTRGPARRASRSTKAPASPSS